MEKEPGRLGISRRMAAEYTAIILGGGLLLSGAATLVIGHKYKDPYLIATGCAKVATSLALLIPGVMLEATRRNTE